MSQFEKQSESDREWLAFRYVAGELAGDEIAAFEAELEASQVAREAVSRAVELCQAIAAAQTQEVELVEAARRKSWIYGVGWIGAGAAAASVAGALWWNMPGSQAGTSELAEIWAASRHLEPAPMVPAEPPLPAMLLDSAEPHVAPSWMTAGVISQSGGKVEDGEGNGQAADSWDDEVLEN